MNGFQILPFSLRSPLSPSTSTGLPQPLLRLNPRLPSLCLPHMLSSLALCDWLLFLSAVPSLPSSLRLEAQSCLLTPPSCLFLDRLQVCSVYDDSPSAPARCFLFHRQCPDSSLVICCLNDCGEPVTLITIHAALLTTAVQYSRSPGLEPSQAKGKASSHCSSSVRLWGN